MTKCKECGQEKIEKSLESLLVERHTKYLQRFEDYSVYMIDVIRIMRQHENKRYLRIFDEAWKKESLVSKYGIYDNIRQAIAKGGEG